MCRFLLVFAVFTAALSEAVADGTLLVEVPPVYQHGESAQGVLIDQYGMQLTLEQEARYGPDQQIYILVTAKDEGGNILSRAIFNPRTWQAQAISETEVTRILNTSCSPKGLYPITLGKVYQCSSILQVNDRTFSYTQRMEFDSVERNKNGHITGFCATEEEGEYKIVTRTCFSPDGKWMRNAHILSIGITRKLRT